MRSRWLLAGALFVLLTSLAAAPGAHGRALRAHGHGFRLPPPPDSCSDCPNQCSADLDGCLGTCGDDSDCQTQCFVAYNVCNGRCNLIDC